MNSIHLVGETLFSGHKPDIFILLSAQLVLLLSFTLLTIRLLRIFKEIPTQKGGVLLKLCLALELIVVIWHVWSPELDPLSIQQFDAIEYVSGTLHVLKDGNYLINLAGTSFPVRYPSWFSVVFILPFLKLVGGSIVGALLLPRVIGTFLIFACATCTYVSGGVWAAIIGLALLIHASAFVEVSAQVMIDMPIAFLILSASVFLITSSNKFKNSATIIPAFLVALAIGLRFTNLVLNAPFFLILVGGRNKSYFLALIATFVFYVTYNFFEFGSIMRTGYNLWTSVPYDFPELTFSLSYISKNLRVILSNTFLSYLLAALIFLRLLNRVGFRSEERFLIVTALTSTIPFVFYFYSDSRFYLLAEILLGIVTATQAAMIIKRYEVSPILAAVLSLGTIAIPIRRAPLAIDLGVIKELAEELSKPEFKNSTIISGINPLYVSSILLHGREDISVVPVSRRVEYASKCLSLKPLANFSPPSALSDSENNHRNAEILKAGCKDIFKTTATEDLKGILGNSSNVYLLRLGLAREEESALGSQVVFEEPSAVITQIEP